MENAVNRCVVYARYSSDNQREVSSEEQIRYCKEFIQNKGYIFVGQYVDKELSGKNANRRQFQKMIDDSKNNTFDIVVVYKNDRFARDCYDKAIYKRRLLNNSVIINYVKEDILNSVTPETVIYECISDGMAAYYSLNLAREVMEKGHLPNAHKCMHNGGIPPLGLIVVNHVYVVNEDEAVIVRKIFDLYANKGYSYRMIAQELNDNCCLNKLGECFKETSIRDMLLNEKYLGTYIYNRRSTKSKDGKRNNSLAKDPDQIIRIENAFDAIVDKETFNKVKKVMDSRKGRNACNQAQEVYLLSGIIKCGKCGSNMHGNRKRTNRNKSFHITYKCNKRDRLGKKVCDTKEINKQYIEKAIMHYISKMCMGDNFKIIMKALKEYEKSQADTSEDDIKLKKKLTKTEKEISNIVNAIAKGFDADELKAAYTSLSEQKKNFIKQLSILESQASEKIIINEVRALKALNQIQENINDNKPLEEYKKMFSAFVDSVEVFESYVTIALKILCMIGCHEPTNTLPQINRPLLEENQIVVWNGGGEGCQTPVQNRSIGSVKNDILFFYKMSLCIRNINYPISYNVKGRYH